MRVLKTAALCAAITAPLVMPASAQETLSVVGSWSGLPLHKDYEARFWNETLPKISYGALNTALTTHDQMGIQGADVYRMLSQGVFDIGSTVADYAVSDAAALEGLDVPMLATDAKSAYEMVSAARPMVDEIYADVFNSKVLGIAPYPPQVVFCNSEIESIYDLKGLKVRASGRMTAKLLEAMGAQGITIGFGEVPGALQRGVIDCAITGAGSGYNAGWWEVSTHLLPVPLGGWDSVVYAMNMDKWNLLTLQQKLVLQDGIVEHIERPAWNAAQGALEEDIACLTGNGSCSYGPAHSMVLVEPTAAQQDFVKGILIETVLPEWAARAGADWVSLWNKTVGATVGVTIETD